MAHTVANNMQPSLSKTDLLPRCKSLEPKDEQVQRGEWGGKLEFILTCVGYAVGLGNVWRFPYLCYKNGGGAFLIPYVLMLAMVGLPLFFMELSFGQFCSLGPITAWKVNPLLKGLGYTMVITNTLVGVYYNVIIAWCVRYLVASLSMTLPWTSCDNEWNTEACRVQDLSYGNLTFWNETSDFNETLIVKSPSEEYFYNKVLNISSGLEEVGGIQWSLAACLGFAWLMVFIVLIKGIASLGKVVYFSSIFPYVLLTAMLIRGVTLPGAMKGIIYYVKPDFARLMDAGVWSDAAVQIFYSLSTCTGGLVAMASYNKFHNNCLRDAFLVPLINCGTSIFSGFVIFSVLGFMAHSKGVEVADVAASGPGLVFVVYPEGLSQMPLPPLWAALFFLMMMTLGFSSEFSMIECFFASFLDEFSGVLRKTQMRTYMFRFICCCIFMCLGLTMVTRGGFYLFNMVDTYIGGFPLLIVGLLECVVLMYGYGYNRFAEDIEMMLGNKPWAYFKICWCFVAPIVLITIIIFKAVQYEPLRLFDDYVYSSNAMLIAWMMVATTSSFIPLWFIGSFFYNGGWAQMKRSMAPLSDWGPAQPEDRTGRYAGPHPEDRTGPFAGPRPVDHIYSISENHTLAYVNDAYNTELGNDTLKSISRSPTKQMKSSMESEDRTGHYAGPRADHIYLDQPRAYVNQAYDAEQLDDATLKRKSSAHQYQEKTTGF